MRYCTSVLAIALAALALTLITNEPAHARAKRETVEIGLSFGRILADASLTDADKFTGRLEISLNMTDRYGYELSLLNAVDSFSDAPAVTLYTFSSIVHLGSSSRYSPYLLAGIGMGNFRSETKSHDGQFMADVGGGVKYYLGDQLVLRIDFRDYVALSGFKHNYSATIGLSYLFDVSALGAAGSRPLKRPAERLRKDKDSRKAPPLPMTLPESEREDDEQEEIEPDIIDMKPSPLDELPAQQLDELPPPEEQSVPPTPLEEFPGYQDEPLPEEFLPPGEIEGDVPDPPLETPPALMPDPGEPPGDVGSASPETAAYEPELEPAQVLVPDAVQEREAVPGEDPGAQDSPAVLESLDEDS